MIALVAKLMQNQSLEVVRVTDEDREGVLKKSLTGRLPLLEVSKGLCIGDALPIARYLAKDHPSFQGQSAE